MHPHVVILEFPCMNNEAECEYFNLGDDPRSRNKNITSHCDWRFGFVHQPGYPKIQDKKGKSYIVFQ
jgi:hypothetical protein